MPNDNEAIALYRQQGILFSPGKASNAGGVATSALEMSQNSMRLAWSFEEVDDKLRGIMISIHKQCQEAIRQYQLDPKDYVTACQHRRRPEGDRRNDRNGRLLKRKGFPRL